jgi:4-hydroxybenzoyl-CoA thioesterase
MPFVRELSVRFPDVDFARVVYYPRFFDYCHQVFEDFFAAEVGVPYARMLQERKVGYPSVHASADFKHPLRFGDVVRIELSTDAVGERSITCRYRLSCRGTACAELKVVVAPVDMEKFTGLKVPDDVRAAFERFR